MGLKIVSEPEDDVVTLAQAKAHLRVDHDDENDLIETLIEAATEYVDGPEGFLGRALIDQTWDLYLDEFPDDEIRIPLPPLIEVEGVFFTDSLGAEQEFDSASYIVDNSLEPGRITLAQSASWPSTGDQANAVRVRFRAGYLSLASPQVADVPKAIKAAILLTIGTLYEHRETLVIGQTAQMLPWTAEHLLRRYRVHTAMA